MRRIFASSRVVPTKINCSVPRRELNAILMGTNKAEELATELEISKENIDTEDRST